jgi:penicillin-binding protein-related factor A (putative recombinase)
MSYKETSFQTEVLHSLNELEGMMHYFKIPDDSLGYKPYDAYLVHNGKFYAFEYKVSRLKTKLNFKAMFSNREHQITAMERVEKSGGESFCIIAVAYKQSNGRYHYSGYMLPYYFLKPLYEKGTCTFEEVEDYKIERFKKDYRYIWDIFRYL